MKTVVDLKIGNSGKITGIKADVLGNKLLELGCLPGSMITLIRTGINQSIFYVKINGNRVALRKNEAAHLEIAFNES